MPAADWARGSAAAPCAAAAAAASAAVAPGTGLAGGRGMLTGMGAAMAMLALLVVGSAAREDGIASYRRYIISIMSFSISKHYNNVILIVVLPLLPAGDT